MYMHAYAHACSFIHSRDPGRMYIWLNGKFAVKAGAGTHTHTHPESKPKKQHSS